MADTAELYSTQWKAYYKKGFGQPTVVYGRTEREALNNALAQYRKNCTMVSTLPLETVVDHVEYINGPIA